MIVYVWIRHSDNETNTVVVHIVSWTMGWYAIDITTYDLNLTFNLEKCFYA